MKPFGYNEFFQCAERKARISVTDINLWRAVRKEKKTDLEGVTNPMIGL